MPIRDIAAPWAVTLTDGEHALIQFAIGVCAFGLVAMLTRLISARREVGDRFRPAVHAGVAVCSVAFLSYVLLIIEFHLGYDPSGRVWVPNAESIGTWTARYMDWIVSVPMLIVEVVAVSAVIGRAASRARLIGCSAAVAMVLIGFLGSVVLQGGTDFGVLLAFGIASSICFVVVYVIVIGVVLRSLPVLPAAARGPMRMAMVVLVVTWFVYPISYGLQGIVSGGQWTTVEHLLFCAADLVAKVAFGLLLLRVARLRTAADVVAENDVHPESIWIDQLRQSEGAARSPGIR